MMMNLFSVFDPCTGSLSLNWLSSMMIIYLWNYNFWVINNNMQTLFKNFYMFFHNELISLMKVKGSSLMFMTIMMFILLNNMMGMLPYVFTSSAHLTLSLSLAMPLWISLMMFGWMLNYNKMLIHLVPKGTPYMLMPFMVIIETISNFIRPTSLGVRLSANMIAGHLLMSLLGTNLNFKVMMMIMLIFIMLMIFELAVSFIQSYVFMTLTALYSSEV